MTDKMQKLIDALAAKKTVQDTVKSKYKGKDKIKKLTDSERIARIEEYLGL